jgi:hypothetical protein
MGASAVTISTLRLDLKPNCFQEICARKHYDNLGGDGNKNVTNLSQRVQGWSDVYTQVQAMADKHVSDFAAGGAHCAAVCSGVVYTVSSVQRYGMSCLVKFAYFYLLS